MRLLNRLKVVISRVLSLKDMCVWHRHFRRQDNRDDIISDLTLKH